MTQSREFTSRKPIRLWPGAVIVTLMWMAIVVLPLAIPDGVMFAMLAGVVGGLLVALWWLFFSRAPWVERIGAILFMVVAVYLTRFVVDESISNALMGRLLPVYSIPVLSLALVAAVAIGRGLSNGGRRAVMAVAILLGCGVFALMRTGGISGDAVSDLHLRWTPTPEELLLAKEANEPAPMAASVPPPSSPAVNPAAPPPALTPEARPAVPAVEKPDASASPAVRPDAEAAASAAVVDPRPEAEWPGFRGPNRDSVTRGLRIETDWAKSPPVQLWRRPLGPGWSSFAVLRDVLFTQEQRGEDEIVAAYKLSTGEPVWKHRDAARFYESNGGPGPRATPAISRGRVYTLGATGIVNALDAATGAVVWSRNAVTDTGATIPGWGIAGSPLIVEDLVVVAASGRLAAYDLATGKPRWFQPTGGGGYSSPHLATIDGVTHILLVSSAGAAGVAPADGTVLWKHEWKSGVGILQPAMTADGDILTAAGDAMGGLGLRRIALERGSGGWTATERWTSRGLKPYFNDFVVHGGHVYGFDGNILSCVDVTNGERKWKGGRYGNGQLLLLPDQDLLLVVSEEGELVLVSATADAFREIARVPAIEGKTWNHPVLVGDILVVRNGEEMAAFRLPVLSSSVAGE